MGKSRAAAKVALICLLLGNALTGCKPSKKSDEEIPKEASFSCPEILRQINSDYAEANRYANEGYVLAISMGGMRDYPGLDTNNAKLHKDLLASKVPVRVVLDVPDDQGDPYFSCVPEFESLHHAVGKLNVGVAKKYD